MDIGQATTRANTVQIRERLIDDGPGWATTRAHPSASSPPSPLLYFDLCCFMYRRRYFYCVYVVFMPFSRVSPFRQRIVFAW